MKPLHIFRAGRHTDMHGREIEFSEADVSASAEAYDPRVFEAPIVVGHPRTDDPAFGWVESLAAENGELLAMPSQVEPAFAEAVRAGRYKKISASFFMPDSPSNPRPGVYYLRHVGFLGAAAPAVKGLKPVAFADAEEGVVELEFGSYEDELEVGVLRRLREWILGKFGKEDADAAVPLEDLDFLTRAAVRPAPGSSIEESPAGFSEPKEERMKDKEQAGKPEGEELKRREVELAEREARIAEMEAKLRRDEAASFVDGLIDAGKVLPAQREFLVSFMAALDDEALEFGEGDDAQSKPRSVAFREFLEALPKAVDFSERAPAGDEPEVEGVRAPDGYAVDQANLELHKKALAYMAEHKDTDYITAVRVVSA